MVKRIWFAAVVLTAIAVAPACSLFKTEARVESDTSWSGSFDGRTVSGTGNQTVDMGSGNGAKCAVVQKQTRNGYLTVSVDGGESKTTYAEFGVVSVCGGTAY